MAHQTVQPYDPYYFQYQQLQQQQQQQLQEHGDSADAGINTLFVAGLPEDIKAREIHNLFRRRPGFDYCQLKYTGRGDQVVAFVTFVNHQSAVAALHSLNRVKFDPQAGSILHIELARSNSRKKHAPVGGGYLVIDKRNQPPGDDRETSSDDDGGSGRDDEPYGGMKDPNVDGAVNEVPPLAAAAAAAAATSGQLAKMDDGHCSTLFIANLGPACTEAEMMHIFSQYDGFKTIKMRNRGPMPVAFADFAGVEQATRAMYELQGSVLVSSDRGGMHIEYARSKMRKS